MRPAERRHLTVLHCAIVSAGPCRRHWIRRIGARSSRPFMPAAPKSLKNLAARSPNPPMTAWSPGSATRRRASSMPSAPFARGWRSLSAVPKLRAGAGAPLRAHVGIASGLVVVGDLAATTPAATGRLGEPSNLAAALLSRAPSRCRVDCRQHAAAGSWTFRTARPWAGTGGGFRTTDRSLASERCKCSPPAASWRCARRSCRRWSAVTKNSNCCRAAGSRQRPAADGSC